ncbi:MAG: radical SAM/SPASM domain-containing protein [Bradymonadia bacterium]
MGILHVNRPEDIERCDPAHQIPRLDFELTQACDHKCGHCYNVWNAAGDEPQAGYPRGQLPTDEYLALMDRLVKRSGAHHITITGGEPLLHKGAMAIIERACALARTVQIITNGSHITEENAALFKQWGVASVQLTLLSADREEHDRLKGAPCFDDTLRAALDLRDAGVPVQVCYVAMAQNHESFEGVLELCCALGVRSIAYNRMSPTGWAIRDLPRLLPQVSQVEAHLDLAERLGPALGIHVSTAMPIPPCLIRIQRYTWVKFGFCSVGTHSPNIVVDALGNVRSCNLSSHIMGNALSEDWTQIHQDPYLHTFKDKVPDMCRGCAYERSCQGGCKESGFAAFGDLTTVEPFIRQLQDPHWRAQHIDAGEPLVHIEEPRP